MARPPIRATSWATAILETVARPMWLSGIRNALATGLITPIWWRDVHEVGSGGRLDLADHLEGGFSHGRNVIGTLVAWLLAVIGHRT